MTITAASVLLFETMLIAKNKGRLVSIYTVDSHLPCSTKLSYFFRRTDTACRTEASGCCMHASLTPLFVLPSRLIVFGRIADLIKEHRPTSYHRQRNWSSSARQVRIQQLKCCCLQFRSSRSLLFRWNLSPQTKLWCLILPSRVFSNLLSVSSLPRRIRSSCVSERHQYATAGPRPCDIYLFRDHSHCADGIVSRITSKARVLPHLISHKLPIHPIASSNVSYR